MTWIVLFVLVLILILCWPRQKASETVENPDWEIEPRVGQILSKHKDE